MTTDIFKDIEKLESDLWDAADNLRANSKLTAGEYCMPVLGVIFLRHATNRYKDALREIQADQAAGKMPKPGPQVNRQLSAPVGGPTTLTDKSLYSDSKRS